jgi:hypothetical protein
MRKIPRRKLLSGAALGGVGALYVASSSEPTLASGGWQISNPSTVKDSSGSLSSLKLQSGGDYTFTLDWSNLSDGIHTIDFKLEARLESTSYESIATTSFDIQNSEAPVSENKISDVFPINILSASNISASDFAASSGTESTSVYLRTTFDLVGKNERERVAVSFDVNVKKSDVLGLDNLVAHYQLDGDFTDDSGNGYGADSVNGSPEHIVSGGVNNNGAYKFESSTNDFAEISGLPRLNSYTITGWVNFSSNSQQGTILYLGGKNSVIIRGDGSGGVSYFQNGPGWVKAGTASVSNNTWHFVAIKWDGSTATAFLDGNKVGSASITSMSQRGNNTQIGAGNNQRKINGKIDDLRIYSKSLSDSLINDIYSKPSFKTLDESAISKYPFDSEGATDTVGTNDGTVVSATYQPSGGPKSDGAYSLDGNSDTIELPSFDFESDGFSISFWAKINSISTTKHQPLIKQEGDFRIRAYDTRYGNASFSVQDDSGVWHEMDLGETPNTGDWTYFGFVYNGSKLVYHKGGTNRKTVDASGKPRSTSPVYIGSSQNSSNYVDTSIDELYIYDRGLTETELNEIYMKSRPNQLGPTNGIVARYPSNSGTGEDTSGNNNDATLKQSIQHVTDGGPQKDGAFYHDKSGNLEIGALNENSDTHTISSWIRMDSLSSSPQWTGIVVNGGWGNTDSFIAHKNGAGIVYRTPRGTDLSASINQTGTWIHVCATHEAGNAKLYINGTEQTSAIDSGGSISINKWAIGSFYRSGNYQLDGSTDDTRIYNRALSATEVQNLYDATK